MEYEHKTLSDDELKHWGILGMKWGVRRYQNKDGTLTAKGKKRYKEEMDKVKAEEQVIKNRKATKAKLDRLAAKKKAVEDEKKELDDAENAAKGKKTAEKPPAKKRVQDMGDEELAYKIRRTQLEKQYEQLTAEPEPVAKGNGFVKEFWNKAATPAIQEAGKTLIRDSLLKLGKKYLGLETEQTKSYLERLKEEHDTLNYEEKIRGLKSRAEKAAAKEKEKAEAKAESKAKTEPKKEPKTEPKTKSEPEPKSVEPEIVWDKPVTSLARSTQGWQRPIKVVDAIVTDVPAPRSNNTPTARLGQSYIAGLLPAPKDDD